MESRWSDADAQKAIEELGPAWGEDLALRVYTSRLIGQDPRLVLHGGGNTSVKTSRQDVLGEPVDVLCVKGTGQDLASIEPEGFPAVELAALRRLRSAEAISDRELVNQSRIHRLDASSPTPSLELLLHAFLPAKFVDHVHADAILVVTNQPDGEALVREALGDDVAILPWIKPGLPLAKAVAEACEQNPNCFGAVLLNHGLVAFGDSARESYERIIQLVVKAEQFVDDKLGGTPPMLDAEVSDDDLEVVAAEIAPVVRGAVAIPTGEPGEYARMLMRWLGAPDLVVFSKDKRCSELCKLGPLTPDHVIRTKGRYLVLSREQAADPATCRAAVKRYAEDYVAYFEAHRERLDHPVRMLDPHPRVIVVKGVGVFAFGEDDKAAVVAADIAAHTLRSKAEGAALGTYQALDDGDLFEMEHWSLEQAKLDKRQPPTLAGRAALISGTGGAIGHGIAAELLAAGASVMATDLDEDRLGQVCESLREEFPHGALCSAVMDVTDAESVKVAFAQCCVRFGGVDVVVPNAGIAHVSTLSEMDPDRFRQVVDVNLTGTMTVLQAAARVFERQGTGGAVVVQASKNVFDPGAGFGAYSASKAGALQLGKIAALELAPLGVRVNMINADAVFGDEIESGLWAEVGPERMKARDLDPEGLRAYYQNRSLLKVPVTARHVGKAVVFLAAGTTPTTGATLPVDAGVPGAFPR